MGGMPVCLSHCHRYAHANTDAYPHPDSHAHPHAKLLAADIAPIMTTAASTSPSGRVNRTHDRVATGRAIARAQGQW